MTGFPADGPARRVRRTATGRPTLRVVAAVLAGLVLAGCTAEPAHSPTISPMSSAAGSTTSVPSPTPRPATDVTTTDGAASPSPDQAATTSPSTAGTSTEPVTAEALWDGVDWVRTMTAQEECTNGDADVDVSYPDITGDGRPDALVTAQCPALTSAWSAHVSVWERATPQADPAALVTVGQEQRYLSVQVSVSGADVRVSGPSRSTRAPGCCADETVDQTWHWNGAAFARTGFTVTPLGWPDNPVAPKPSLVTPSGNIWCALIGDSPDAGVSCAIAQHEFPVDTDCIGQPGTWVHLDPTGAPGPALGCWGDLFTEAERQPVTYGATVTFGPGVQCSVAESGVTCANRDGHGFTLSRAAYVPS